MANGLVLEGGAMRGMFTAGVTDVMMENKIQFDGAVGVSAGAAFGCNYKSNQPGRAIRYNITYCNDPRYCGVRSLIKTGDIYGAEFCYHTIPNELDIFDSKTFKNSPMEFYVVCTDVKTGKPVYRKLSDGDDKDVEWMRASASMPLVSKIVKIDDNELLDGGISDSIPLKFFESIGYDKNVVVLTQPRDYVKTENNLMPIIRISLKKYPNAITAIRDRHLMYNSELEYVKEREKSGSAFVIAPKTALPIGHIEHNPEKLKEIYKIGRETAEKLLPDLKNFLEI